MINQTSNQDLDRLIRSLALVDDGCNGLSHLHGILMLEDIPADGNATRAQHA